MLIIKNSQRKIVEVNFREDYWIGMIKTQGSIDVLIKEDNE